MYDRRRKGVTLLSDADDRPKECRGQLIPCPTAPLAVAPVRSPLPPSLVPSRALLLPVLALLAFLGLGAVGYATVSSEQVAAPIVSVVHPHTNNAIELQYGVNRTLTEPDFYTETRDAFIDQALTFIEADLTQMQLRYFENGVLAYSTEILSKGREGSWWETPAGLYQIELKKDNHFSSFGQVYQPWSMVFQGNFFIHGWPEYPDGSLVSSAFSGGCIRLDTAEAERLYRLVSVGTPVLVHEIPDEPDDFIYEPKVPELDTPHYLIADIHTNTVLAASDLNEAAPIASVTKLMTALIAAEYINLDQSVSINSDSFVISLIPRLGERQRVSMYSLLQLLLVESSNEAAEVIAAQIGRENFIARMNQKAESLGMSNTTFTDPSGLDNGNVSSLRDLLRLTQYIAENRSFILGLTRDADLPTLYAGGQFGELANFNLIEDVPGFIGGKVGETRAAGQTSVSLHELTIKGEKRELAVIILGSDGRSEDVLQLLEYARERYGE